MSNSLKNIIETIETDSDYEHTLKFRRENIKKFSFLGPADLCYLTKNFTRSLVQFTKPSKSGFYHFVYGLNTTSPAAVSAYLNNLLQLQEPDSTWFSNGKWIITKAVICIYNPYDRIDINLEIDIPGGIKLFGYNSDGGLLSIDEKIWERAHIGSVLRSMLREVYK
jgi:Chs5-Arf1p-binding protein BUD7/BCH1